MSRKFFPLCMAATLTCGIAMAEAPRVAVDITPVHSLVSRVMEGVGSPKLIVQAGATPHEYRLRPSEAAALQDADLVFWLGEGLTPWMADALATLATNAAVTELLEADGTIRHDFREGALFEGHEHDNASHTGEKDRHEKHAKGEKTDHQKHGHQKHGHEKHGHEKHGHDSHAKKKDHKHGVDHAHDHGAHDPHAWLSLQNASTWLNLIAAQLSVADPKNAGDYFGNAAAARAEIESLSAEIRATLDPMRGGSFIVFHDAYQYFEVDFDFPAAGAISVGDAADPSPARIAQIQERIREEGVDCVLSEPQFNKGLVATVLDGTAANTGVIDPLGAELEPGPNLYPALMRNMATTLAKCLGQR